MSRNTKRAALRHYLQAALVSCAALLLRTPALLAQDEPMRTITIDGRVIAYHVLGTGSQAPLILVSGGPGFDHQYFHLSNAWNRLSVDRRVVFFDQPGTGGSYRVTNADTLSVRDVLVAIRKIQNELGAQRVALLGHSWGGYVAMAFAAACPRCRSTIQPFGIGH